MQDETATHLTKGPRERKITKHVFFPLVGLPTSGMRTKDNNNKEYNTANPWGEVRNLWPKKQVRQWITTVSNQKIKQEKHKSHEPNQQTKSEAVEARVSQSLFTADYFFCVSWTLQKLKRYIELKVQLRLTKQNTESARLLLPLQSAIWTKCLSR